MSRILSHLCRFLRAHGGSTAVEFAMILPVFLAIIFGIMEFGRMIWARNTIEHAAETAARWGAINTSATSAQIVTQAQNNIIVLDPASPSFDFNADATTSSLSSVTITYTFTSLAAAFGIPSITLTATAQIPR